MATDMLLVTSEGEVVFRPGRFNNSAFKVHSTMPESESGGTNGTPRREHGARWSVKYSRGHSRMDYQRRRGITTKIKDFMSKLHFPSTYGTAEAAERNAMGTGKCWLTITFCLVFAALMTVCEAGREIPQEAQPMFFILDAEPSNQTHFILGQDWSAGVFKRKGHQYIKESMKNFWTIHSLWPVAHSTICNKTLPFDQAVLEPLVPQLKEFWPSFSDYDVLNVWKREWNKHGSCAVTNPETRGLFNYFNTTLSLYFNHNITQYFHNGGILPTLVQTYPVEEVRKALSDGLRASAEIRCYKSKDYVAPVLYEVSICFGENFAPVNCKKQGDTCDKERLYYLPFDEPPSNSSALVPTSGSPDTTQITTATTNLTDEASSAPMRDQSTGVSSTPKPSQASRMSPNIWLITRSIFSPVISIIVAHLSKL